VHSYLPSRFLEQFGFGFRRLFVVGMGEWRDVLMCLAFGANILPSVLVHVWFSRLRVDSGRTSSFGGSVRCDHGRPFVPNDVAKVLWLGQLALVLPVGNHAPAPSLA